MDNIMWSRPINFLFKNQRQ